MNDIVRTVTISARLETVFRYFTDAARFAACWGEGSRIEPRAGGAVLIKYPGGTTVSGVVKEIDPPRRVVFTYGYETPGHAIGPGSTTVIVSFEERPRGTLVTLRHTGLPDAPIAKEHVQGWRYQLALFSKVAAADQHAGLAAMVDGWFDAFAEPDAARRAMLLTTCSTPDVTFRDDYGALAGHDDLHAHIAASQLHMPGVRLFRVAEPRQCQGAALARWEARDPSGKVLAAGTNAMELAPDGRIAGVVGFWGA